MNAFREADLSEDHDVSVGMTLTDYRLYLESTASAYPCLGFEVLDGSSAHGALTLPEHFALIRHDVDMSPDQALAMARIEAELGVRATYTILLTGDFYSPFEARVRGIFQEIADLGHDIGLHFDASYHEIRDDLALGAALSWEHSILEKLLDGPQIEMFSFHNTTPFTMSCRASHYGKGLRNAYAGVLQDNCAYTSDSNGYWRYLSWQELLAENHPRIQVLTHPEWWQNEDSEPAQKLARILMMRDHRAWRSYCALLNDAGRINRTGLDQQIATRAQSFDEFSTTFLLLWLSGYKAQSVDCLREHLTRGVISDPNPDTFSELLKSYQK